MSALRLALSAAVEVSAPAELDSACADCDLQTPPVSRGDLTHLRPFIHLRQSPIHSSSGGLGTVLEEELAMLTREREEELIASEQDTDLLSLFRQKERDLVLAAKLGKALLERNQDLRKQYEKITKDLNLKLENLKQEKHELQQRLARREGEWESRVAELESDMQYLKAELEKHKMQLREADRGKMHIITELSEQNYSLQEQLRNASDVERRLYTQVHSLQDDFREKNISKNQHMTQLESLQAEQGLEIKMLSEYKQELERCITTYHEENMQLKCTVDNLKERTLVLERIYKEKDLQLQQSRLEVQELCVSHQQLSARLAEMTEERSFPGFSSNTHSLLCEIEQSIEHEELKQEREQLRLLLWEVYYQIRSICSQLSGNYITDSALTQDLCKNESSKTSSATDMFMGKLKSSLLDLQRLAQNLLDGDKITESHHGDEDVLKEQMRKLGEELWEAQDLYKQEQKKVQSTQEEILQLHNQICSSQEENERLRISRIPEPSVLLQNAIRERDDAITKKNAVEMELAKCKVDNMSLNSQLLDALQQKINLSQQLEAWQFASSGLFTVWLLWFLI